MIIKYDKKSLKQLDAKKAMALEATGHDIRDEVREAWVVPRDTGTLQDEAFTIDARNASNGVVTLNFDTPYARRLYFHPEYNFRKDKNPNAQGLWMRHWQKGGMYEDHASKIMAKILKRLG